MQNPGHRREKIALAPPVARAWVAALDISRRCGILIPQARSVEAMPFDSIIWDLDDDPDGNVQHCAEHGVTKEEVEEVFENATDADISQSTGRPVVFGDTSTGRHLIVVYEEVDADTVYPVTAYDVPRGAEP
jgi:uncharacterized DUF497 family protein